MKKVLMITISIMTFSSVSLAIAKHFWRGEIMPRDKVCKTWVGAPFDSKKFKNGDEAAKASMACSLLKRQNEFIGKDRSEIREDLGDFDGFYFSDMFPAYMIQSGNSKDQDSWQIVFLLDNNEKVSEVVVHKNCCD
jgi:hypothetical protein